MSTYMELGKLLGVDNFSLHLIDEIDKVDGLIKNNTSSLSKTELREKKEELNKIRNYYMN